MVNFGVVVESVCILWADASIKLLAVNISFVHVHILWANLSIVFVAVYSLYKRNPPII